MEELRDKRYPLQIELKVDPQQVEWIGNILPRIKLHEERSRFERDKSRTAVVTPNKQNTDRTIPYSGPVNRQGNKSTALKKALGMADISKLDNSSSDSAGDDSVITVTA